MKLEGKTMGTTYHITYLDSAGNDHQQAVDSVLVAVNNSMSTYIPTSLISEFNRMDVEAAMPVDSHFYLVYEVAKSAYLASDGAFDPTVMPLVNLFGFGYEKLGEVDSAKVDSIKAYLRFDAVSVKLLHLKGDLSINKELQPAAYKDIAEVQLDFSAVAKGYGVDVVGLLLESKGIQNYMVEIGGEVRARGHNASGSLWRIGIDKPQEGAAAGQEFEAIISLDNESMATSGNYRNFKEQDGKKYVHTINPKTGWPEISNTLSVSVIAKDCATADAYATTFMVMGVEKGYELATRLKEEGTYIEAYFIYAGENGELLTKATPGLEGKLKEVE